MSCISLNKYSRHGFMLDVNCNCLINIVRRILLLLHKAFQFEPNDGTIYVIEFS